MKCTDLENLIIKGHLIIEQSINKFIQSQAIAKTNLDDVPFSTKVKIAQLLGLFHNKNSPYKNIILLNRLRNSIAHKLDTDMKLFESFISSFDHSAYSKASEDRLTGKATTDKQKNFGYFARRISYIQGFIGASGFWHYLERNDKGDLAFEEYLRILESQ